MRSDYILYIVAIIFFLITAISYAVLLPGFERNLSVVATAVLGLLFIGLGYSMKPKTASTSSGVIAAPPQAVTAQPVTMTQTPTPQIEKTEMVIEPMPPPTVFDLTSVKGIKAKRAEQLKSLGVNSIQKLANASAQDLAAKLKISSKFTEQWIANAKELLAKA